MDILPSVTWSSYIRGRWFVGAENTLTLVLLLDPTFRFESKLLKGWIEKDPSQIQKDKIYGCVLWMVLWNWPKDNLCRCEDRPTGQGGMVELYIVSVLWTRSRMKVPQNKVQLPQKAWLSEQVSPMSNSTFIDGYCLRTWRLLILPPLSTGPKPAIPYQAFHKLHLLVKVTSSSSSPSWVSVPLKFRFDHHGNTTQSCSHVYLSTQVDTSSLSLISPAFKNNTKKGKLDESA